MNRLKRYILLLSWGLCSNAVLSAQNISIQGKLDRAEIKTGEQVAIDLRIRTNALEQTKFYLKQKPSEGDPYTVIAFGALDTVDLDGQLKEITARLVLTSFDSTLITIPPIVAENPSGQAETEPMALNVIQPEVDAAHPNSFKDIKAPWQLSLGLWDWLELILRSWVFWAFIALCVLAYGLYKFLTRKKVIVAEQPTLTPRLSLWERTEQRLRILESTKPQEQEEFKAYYTELVSIIKDYLDEAKRWDTLEMTSSELRDKLKAEQLAQEQIVRLGDILMEADLSKFAKASPSQDAAMEALYKAKMFLQTMEREGASSSSALIGNQVKAIKGE